tara:strand:- start:1065 stop:1544 length:480 start_codon:yes stop_codon:yes gene_type:complete
MKPNVKHKMDSKSKINYNSMKTDDLIHLISNQILNEEITENNKLVIQDCCKELFTKKCDKYKKITYVKSRTNFQYCRCCGSSQVNWECESCDASNDDIGRNSVKTRICEVVHHDGFHQFPKQITRSIIEKFDRLGHYSHDEGTKNSYTTYTIIKIESFI